MMQHSIGFYFDSQNPGPQIHPRSPGTQIVRPWVIDSLNLYRDLKAGTQYIGNWASRVRTATAGETKHSAVLRDMIPIFTLNPLSPRQGCFWVPMPVRTCTYGSSTGSGRSLLYGLAFPAYGSFPRLGVLFVGVPIRRTTVFWRLSCGPPIWETTI